jgi:hypothetical protein
MKLAEKFDLMQPGVPEGKRLTVAEDFRIVPPPDLYGPLERQSDATNKLRNYGVANPDREKVIHEDNKAIGTKFEMLKTAIMHKHTEGRFIVVRSSFYDDNENGVDNVLVDTVSGHTVCAFDEISNSTFRSGEVAKKASQVLGKNFGAYTDMVNDATFGVQEHSGEKGAKLKYGIKLHNGELKCEEMSNLPIFILSLDYDHLDEGIRTFVNGKGKGLYETELFNFFLKTLENQIKILKENASRYNSELPQEMRERIESLEKYLQETRPKKS